MLLLIAQVINAIMDNDLASLIKSRSLDAWRETLALFCTYARSDEWGELCSKLAKHLVDHGHTKAAILCYVCAGNVDEAVLLWSRDVGESLSDVQSLQTLLEKAVILGLATGHRTASPVLGELVTRYASLLAAHGSMASALQYLDMVPGEACAATSVLKHRIFVNGSSELNSSSCVAPFPYETYSLNAAPAQPNYNAAQQQSAYSAQQSAYSQQPAAPAQQQQHTQYSNVTSQAPTGYGSAAAAASPAQQPKQYTFANFTPANQGVGAQSVKAPDPNASTGYVPTAPPQVASFVPQAVPNPAAFQPQAAQPQAVAQPTAFVPQVRLGRFACSC